MKRLGFLQDASDRFEVMCREPKDPVLIRLEKDTGGVGLASEIGPDFYCEFGKV